jgi:hypothetical protein
VKLFLQKHPRENRLVTVITLENYLSQDYIKRKDAMINQMAFQSPPGKSDDDKLLRISTKTLLPGSPIPLITFGNNRNSQTFFQATTDMTLLESDVVTMTNYVYRLLDEALSKAIQEMTNTIISVTKDRQTSRSSRCESFSLDSQGSSDSDKFGFTVGKHSPKDAVDTLVSLVYKKNTYTHHNDAADKYCIHDNSNIITHANEMRVFSHRFRFGNIKENINQIAASITHGIPDSESNRTNHEFCHVVGYWSSPKGVFRQVKKGEKVKITMRGEVHAHIQLPGSQSCNLHHFIRDNHVKDVHTVVLSPRTTQKLQSTVLMQERVLGNYFNDSGAIISENHHVTNNIVELFQNQKRTAPAPKHTRSPDAPRVSSHLNKRRVILTNESTEGQDQWKLSKTSYSNGPLMKDEYTERQLVYGFPLKKGIKEQIGRSVHATNAWLAIHKTVHYQTKDGVAVVGPWVQESLYENNAQQPSVQLFRPGDVDETMCMRVNITSNKHCKAVVSRKVVDVVNLHRISKNGPGLAENLCAIFRAKANFLKNKATNKTHETDQFVADELVPMIMRGKGGAMTLAGSVAVDPSNKFATRDAPTHRLPIYQNLDEDIQSLFLRTGSDQTVNVFYQNHYIGLFYLESVEFRRYSRRELSMYTTKFEGLMKELNFINPDLFPHSSITMEMEQELLGMKAKCYHFKLVPVDKNFLRRWEWKNMEESNHWKVILLSDDDIEVPKRFEDKEKGKKLMSLEESCEITDCFSLMKHSNDKFCFLNDNAKERLNLANVVVTGAAAEEEEDSTIYNDDPEILADSSTMLQDNDLRFTMEDILNGAIHVSAVNMAKAFDKRVVNAKHGRIIPPRDIINAFTGDSTGDPEKYHDGLQKTGLKPILTRPTHPHIITSDPVASLAYSSIKANTKNTSGKKENQWVVIFTCIFCSVVNPPALLQLHQKWKGDGMARQTAIAPSPNDLDDILKLIENMKWEGKFIHPIYRKVFVSKEKFIRFLKHLKARGKDIFETLITQHDGNRSNSLNSLIKEFGIFSPFQLHAFMRIIETCIFEPFGEVSKVPSAYGGICGARCFIRVYKKLNPAKNNMSDKEILTNIPSWIVTWYNQDVQERIETGNENIKQQTKDELLVLQLSWSIEHGCLVHTQGIKKKFDSSDAEHMLCMFYCLVVNTLPSRNMCKTMKPPKIDSEKYFPIYQLVDDEILMNHPFMAEETAAYQRVMETYQKMLVCEDYAHHRLRDKFQIDIIKSDNH